MFGKKAALAMTTIIGKGTCVNGGFSAESSVRIDGTVEGDVTLAGDLIIGATGKVNGDIEAMSAIIGGEVIGNVVAEKKVELTATAKVLGDIYTNGIVIDENAVFQGKCDMNQNKPEKPKKKKAALKTKSATAPKKSAKLALQEALMEVKNENVKEAEVKEDKEE